MIIPNDKDLTDEQLKLKYEKKMTISNEELYALFQKLSELQNANHSRTFSVALARNIRTLEPLVKDLEREKIDIFQQYELQKDGEGETVVDQSGQFIFKNPQDQRQAQQEFLAWLQNTNTEVTLQTVSESHLPEEISATDLIQLNPMIRDLDLSPQGSDETKVKKDMDTEIQEEVVYSDEKSD